MFKLHIAKKDILAALFVFVFTLAIYLLTVWRNENVQSPSTAYFNELASSFLHKQLYLSNPADTYDLTYYKGHWYVPFPPLPALLMLPWVALFGSINTIYFSVLFGALNTCLVFLMLRSLATRGRVSLSLPDCLWLAILFGLGSVHWNVARVGSVWVLGQICAVTFMALSVWLALEEAPPFMSGLALAAAIAARPHVILMYFTLIGISLQTFQNVEAASKLKVLLRWAWQSLIPIALAVLGLLTYNWLRFDHPLDFGYLTQNVAANFSSDLRVYGQFNLHFVPKNLWVMLFALPKWDPVANALLPSSVGMSLLITSPAIIYLGRARQRSPIVIGAWLSIALILVPLLMYYNTGEHQFGYRFSLDFMIPLMLLLAFACRERMPLLMRILIAIGVLVNVWGTRF